MNVIGSGYAPIPLEAIATHTHKNWEIILNTSGSNISVIGGTEYEIHENDIMVVPPMLPHGAKNNGESYTDIYVTAKQLNFDGVVMLHDHEGAIRPLMNLILKAVTGREPGYHDIADSLLEAVCAYITKYRGMNYKYPFVADFKNILFENISNADFDMSEAIKRFGFSSDYFRRCFFADTGKTPVQFLTFLRINMAKKLLYEYNISITEISARCGFSDNYYFSRRFHKEVGMTPGEYRTKSRQRG